MPIIVFIKMKGKPKQIQKAILSSVLCFVIFVVCAINDNSKTTTLRTAQTNITATSPATTPTTSATPAVDPVVKVEPTAPKLINCVADLNSDDVKSAIKNRAESEWGTNYRMVKFEINTQTESYNYLKDISIKSKVHETIMKNALKEWNDNFRMVKFEYDTQLKAYNDL
jgi:hypothetical protein